MRLVGLAEGLMGAGFGCARCGLGAPVEMSLGGSVRRFTLVGLVTCGCVTGFPVPVRPSSCRRPPFTWVLEIPCWILDIRRCLPPLPVYSLLSTTHLSREAWSPPNCAATGRGYILVRAILMLISYINYPNTHINIHRDRNCSYFQLTRPDKTSHLKRIPHP
jgi:hypothetical protein